MAIRFNEAIAVACVGLAVNVICALLLREYHQEDGLAEHAHHDHIHVWRVGPRHLTAIVSLVAHDPREPDHYKRLPRTQRELVHVTVEVHRCPDGTSVAA